MILQEAIKSGKPFRRAVWGRMYPKDWYVKRKSDARARLFWIGEVMIAMTEKGAKSFTNDIIATDWEVKE